MARSLKKKESEADFFGAYAERLAVSQWFATRIPETVTFEAASTIRHVYGTAWYALVERGQLKAGETVFVTGAAGGVGLATVDLAKYLAHIARARAWREAHPGHTRGTPRKSSALQDPLIAQAHDFKEENGKRTGSALQDLLNPSSPALAGLIAHLFGVTLQDDLTATARLLVQLGQNLLCGESHASSDASHEGRKVRQALPDVRPGVSRPTD